MKNKNIIKVILYSVATLVFIAVLSIVLINVFIDVYTVSFNTNGGSKIESIEVKSGNKVSKPEDPVKKDYAFYEWQLDGETFNFQSKIKSDITLDAVWNDFYTVEFDTNGSDLVIPSQTVEHGKFITSVATPEKQYYTFSRWEVEGKVYDETTPITSNVTFVAIYDYNITQVQDFIAFFSKNEVQANIKVNNNSAKLDFTSMLTGNMQNGTFTQFNKELNEVTNHGSEITSGNYKYYSSTKEEELPLYLSGIDSSSFEFKDGAYVSGDIKVSYLSKNNFKIVFNNNTYEINLQQGVEVEAYVHYHAAMYYFLFDNTAILLKDGYNKTSTDQYLNDNIKFNNNTYICTEIADEAFKNSDITTIILNESLVKIGKEAFAYCAELTFVDTERDNKNLELISEKAFKYCKNLKYFIVPRTVKEIKHAAFADCNETILYIYSLESDFIALGDNWNGAYGHNTYFNWDGKFQ